jgi:hypothetical protein
LLVDGVGTWHQIARIHTSYRTTQGSVVRSAVVVNSDGRHSWSRGVVEYRYDVDGRPFAGDRFLPGMLADESQSQAEAQARVDGHPPDSPVIVYYDPANPVRAVLDPRIPGAVWIASAFTLVFTAGGLLVAYAAWRNFRKAGRIANRSTRRPARA